MGAGGAGGALGMGGGMAGMASPRFPKRRLRASANVVRMSFVLARIAL